MSYSEDSSLSDLLSLLLPNNENKPRSKKTNIPGDVALKAYFARELTVKKGDAMLREQAQREASIRRS
jgi:hypothetical protein